MCPAFSSSSGYFMLFRQHNDVLQHLRQAVIYEISEIFGLFTLFIDISKGLLSNLLSSNTLLQSWSLQPQRSLFRARAAFPILRLWGSPTAPPNTKRIKAKVIFWVCKTLEPLHAETWQKEGKIHMPLSNTELLSNIPNYFPPELQLEKRTARKLHWVWWSLNSNMFNYQHGWKNLCVKFFVLLFFVTFAF